MFLEIFCEYSELGRVEGTGRIVDAQPGKLSFLANHARVLLVIVRDPASCLRDIAAACHVTERTVLSIVTDLFTAHGNQR